MNIIRANYQRHATFCGNGCGAFVEAQWKFCSFCGREKHKGDRHALPLDQEKMTVFLSSEAIEALRHTVPLEEVASRALRLVLRDLGGLVLRPEGGRRKPVRLGG